MGQSNPPPLNSSRIGFWGVFHDYKPNCAVTTLLIMSRHASKGKTIIQETSCKKTVWGAPGDVG